MKLNEVHHTKQVGATVIAPDGRPALVWCLAPRRKDEWGAYVGPQVVWLWRDGHIVLVPGLDMLRSTVNCADLEVVHLHEAYTAPRRGRRFETQATLLVAA